MRKGAEVSGLPDLFETSTVRHAHSSYIVQGVRDVRFGVCHARAIALCTSEFGPFSWLDGLPLIISSKIQASTSLPGR